MMTSKITMSTNPLKTALSKDKGARMTTNHKNFLGESSPAPLSETQIQKLLEQGYTRGLSKSLDEMKDRFALRIWIVDNSTSMNKMDGHKIHQTSSSNIEFSPCSRWDEIVECVNYHIDMAALIEAPTRFRMLNRPPVVTNNKNGDTTTKTGRKHPQFFSIAENPNTIVSDAEQAKTILKTTQPYGATPLTKHIQEIKKEVSDMAPELNMLGKKVAIIIATDGLPTADCYDAQGEFVEALRSLEGLPVWVVIRLCTDQDSVVDFYNDLDGQLELSLEVLDDFVGEAKEVTGENPWLNYALPLHRLREMGYHDRVFDMLDERLLTKSELKDFCAILFEGGRDYDSLLDGGVSATLPDPSLHWQQFMTQVEGLLQKENPQFDPIKCKIRSWINTKKLNRIHGKKNMLRNLFM